MDDQVKGKSASGGVSTVKATRKGRTRHSRLSSKHQVTIPVDVMREAGLEVGDHLVFSVEDGAVKIKAMTDGQKLLTLVGALGGIYEGYDHEAEMNDAWED